MEINSICICGAGTMGSGIAQAAAQAGLATILYEVNAAVLEKAKAGMERNLQSLVEKGKITADQKLQTYGLIRFTDDLQTCLADVFIEAIVEKPELKIALFNQLAELNHGDVICASNTSSLSITEIAKGVLHPERVIGRSRYPIFQPEKPYEREGIVPNVVFPCGSIVRGGKLFIYYGGGDRVIGSAGCPLPKLLKQLQKDGA